MAFSTSRYRSRAVILCAQISRNNNHLDGALGDNAIVATIARHATDYQHPYPLQELEKICVRKGHK